MFAYQVFTLDNGVQAGEYRVAPLDLQTLSRERVTADGLHCVERLALPPGRCQIRYAAEQPGGGVRSVVAPLGVPMSGILLASNATTGQFMLREESDLRERLAANSTSVRTFMRGDTITAYVEVYSDDTRVTADDLIVTGVVRTADFTTVREENAQLKSDESGRCALTAEVTTGDRLTPGDYTFTVKASVAGEGRRDAS